MKKIILFFSFLVFINTAITCIPAYANIASIGYIHNTINTTKGINIPIPENSNINRITSVRYLMQQIDFANDVLNGVPTYYASGASTNIISSESAARNINDLIIKIKTFELTLESVNIFDFQISAAGNFTIDWGDGTIDTIAKSNTTNTKYSHTYSQTANYTIKIDGVATAYNISSSMAAISFQRSINRIKIRTTSGSLAKVFGTISGVNPRFYGTFYSCSGMTGITSDLFMGLVGTPSVSMFYSTFYNCQKLLELPSGLFSGMSGIGSSNMFNSTFYGCLSLSVIPNDLFKNFSLSPGNSMFVSIFYGCTGLVEIPDSLFSWLVGAPAGGMFDSSFAGCTGLTQIPSGLFSGIRGAPAASMFASIFSGCTGLSEIPVGLFSGIRGAPAARMFSSSFMGCIGLSEIPSGLFSGISGAPAGNMFANVFSGCKNITSEIPAGLFGEIYGTPAIYMFASSFYDCVGISGEIPSGLFGVLTGSPATGMFFGTFSRCGNLSGAIPSGLFGVLTGSPAQSMFTQTFYGCVKITSIDGGIWDLTGLADENISYAFDGIFGYCRGLISESPSLSANNQTKIWEHFTFQIGTGAFAGNTKMPDYDLIPAAWK